MNKVYKELKQTYKDFILLFRFNNIYKAYNHDKKIICQVLNISAPEISENNLNYYMRILLRCGYRVAIVEQINK